jgi:hypothetical protein
MEYVNKKAEDFVRAFKNEKEGLLDACFSTSYPEMWDLINSLKLNTKQMESLRKIIDLVLTDAFYTVLMGLDGEANIGGVQQHYKIYDEKNNLISKCGELEVAAYEVFKK